MTYPVTIVSAVYKHDYTLHLVFNDGVAADVDLSSFLDGSVFEPLRDTEYFKKFFLDGWTVTWPNGADIAPETLHELASSSKRASLSASEQHP